MNKIAILIPTRNRSEFIDDFINISLKKYDGSLFNILIIDSSSDEKTAYSVSSYNKDAKSKIAYFRLPFDTKTDEKILFGLSKIKSNYLYLQSDKYITDLGNLESFLIKKEFFKYDILNINSNLYPFYKYNKEKKTNVIYDSNNLLEFCSKTFSYMTLYGASIVKVNLLRNARAQEVWANYIYANYGCYLYVTSLFTGACFSSIRNSKYGICFLDFIKLNKKTATSWSYGISWFDTFFKEFNRDVDLLPSFYDSVKSHIITQYHKDWEQLRFRSLLTYKEKGTLKFSYIKKYKKEIKRCHYNYGLMVFVSLFIPSFICRIIQTICHRIKG